MTMTMKTTIFRWQQIYETHMRSSTWASCMKPVLNPLFTSLVVISHVYSTGDGVEQDFHLAKRFYDQAASFDADARLPRAVALALLEVLYITSTSISYSMLL